MKCAAKCLLTVTDCTGLGVGIHAYWTCPHRRGGIEGVSNSQPTNQRRPEVGARACAAEGSEHVMKSDQTTCSGTTRTVEQTTYAQLHPLCVCSIGYNSRQIIPETETS